MNIIFFGTPYFAIHSLQSLINQGYNILAVVTSEDKKQGRGLKIKPSEIKEFAIKKDITVLQPNKLQENNFINQLSELSADLFVVVAFRMLPEKIWKLPKYGTINLHTSLLPNYRGAAPMNWAIINGEKKTGLTTFFINNKIDSGNIILQKEVKIPNSFNVGDLHNKLMLMGGDLLIKTIISIENKTIKEIKQLKNKNIRKAPKLKKKDCKINWKNNINNIHNLIRGLSPYPVAFTNVKLNSHNVTMKIYKANPKIKNHNNSIGTIEINKKKLIIWGLDGYLDIIELQLSGKKRMNVKDFLNGFKILKNPKVS